MHSPKLATSRRGSGDLLMDSAVSHAKCAWIWSLLSFAFFTAYPAHAQATPSHATPPATIVVTIQPANGSAQKTTCGDAYKCTLPVTIQRAGKTAALTVNVFYVPGNVRLTFKASDGFLYAADNPQADPKNPMYMATWGRIISGNTPVKADISLFEPAVPIAVAGPWLTAPGKAVVDLAVTLEKAP